MPHAPRTLRLLALLVGAVTFVWMSLEDNHLWPVLLLGVLLAAVLVALWAGGRWGGLSLRPLTYALFWVGIAALTGLSASVTVMLLMLFKNAWHAHLFPDFPTALMGDVLARAPVWAVAGGLLGLAVALVQIGLRDWREDTAERPADEAKK